LGIAGGQRFWLGKQNAYRDFKKVLRLTKRRYRCVLILDDLEIRWAK
jgi:hypothetical protein